tara:strand:- start:3873 stop:4142 length:270 start_codon:yes stop_codon:yes gene_type:complete
MGLIKAIATLINAFPILAKLLGQLNDAIKEKNARERYEEKTDRIDDAINTAISSGVSADSIKFRGSDVETSRIQSSSESSTTFHKGSAE